MVSSHDAFLCDWSAWKPQKDFEHTKRIQIISSKCGGGGGVSSCVAGQIGSIRKNLRTQSAAIWVLSCMSSCVDGQIG